MLVLSAFFATALAGDPDLPRPKYQKIGECACEVMLPDGATFEPTTKSEDGSDVYQGSVKSGDFEYGVIAVKFGPDAQGGTKEDQLGMLEGYMEYLKTQLKITGAVGYGRGHTLRENAPDYNGMIDYWQDEAKAQYEVVGWTNGKMLVFQYVVGPTSFPNASYKDVLFHSFRTK